MITQQDIIDLCNAASKAGFNVHPDSLTLLQWAAGLQTHIPLQLPANNAAVYIFKWNNNYLKVGKVNANSNARYQSQHYNPSSSKSNLSKSILNNIEFQELLGDGNAGEWLKINTTRVVLILSHSPAFPSPNNS